ncbi:hypothetical protein BIW11_11418, partial [Tropilaelaps mercedesae]
RKVAEKLKAPIKELLKKEHITVLSIKPTFKDYGLSSSVAVAVTVTVMLLIVVSLFGAVVLVRAKRKMNSQDTQVADVSFHRGDNNAENGERASAIELKTKCN